MRSRIEPMNKIARALWSHRALILNYFRARKQFSSGVVESLQQQGQTDHAKILRLPHMPSLSSVCGFAARPVTDGVDAPLCQRSCRPDRIGTFGGADIRKWLDTARRTRTE